MTRLPSFVVIGAPRSGTTSLFYYLGQHPDVFLPVRKELHYFSYPTLARHCAGPGDRRVLRTLCATWEDYRAHYRGVENQSAVGEVSPSYLLHSSARHEMAARLGPVQIIAVLRDPVEKAFSQHSLLVRQGREDLDFAAALAAEEGRRNAGWGDIWWYEAGARYARGIEEYAETFGGENMFVVTFQDLRDDTAGTMAAMFRFLHVDDSFSVDTTVVRNRSGKARSAWLARMIDGDSMAKRVVKRVVPEAARVSLRLRLADLNAGAKAELDGDLRRELEGRFSEDVRRLETFLGLKTGWGA